jgi:hypothetical protein
MQAQRGHSDYFEGRTRPTISSFDIEPSRSR